MSDIRITVTKELMQKYLDKAIQMRDEAEIYANEENQRRRENYKKHRDALLGVIGEKPEDDYLEHYKDIQVVHQEVEKVLKQPWWKFKKPKMITEFVKKHKRFYFTITSDHPSVVWEYEKRNVNYILKKLPKDQVKVFSFVYKDIDDIQKTVDETCDTIEVDPEYLVELDKRYSSVDNVVGVSYFSYTSGYDTHLSLNNIKTTATITFEDGYKMFTVKLKTYVCTGESLIVEGRLMPNHILEKIKTMSDFHNKERLTGRSCHELMIEAGLK